MIIAAYLLSFLCLILNASLFVRLKPPYNFFFAFPIQLVAVDLSPFLAVLGLLGAGLGWLYHAPIAVAAGLLGAGISVIYIALVTVPQPGFDLAFGKDWKTRIPPSRESHMLKRRWNLGWPRTGEPRWERDIPFWTIPGTDRKLLCDVWQPPEGVARSGLAFVYLHGSGWYIVDKDFGTRPLFRHLAAQGHVIMDVAYRLCPEVDIYGMVGDVKRAVAWMKANAGPIPGKPRAGGPGGRLGGRPPGLAGGLRAPPSSAYSPGCTGMRSIRTGGRILLRPNRFASVLPSPRPGAADRPAQSGDRIAWRRGYEEEYDRRGANGYAPGGPPARGP